MPPKAIRPETEAVSCAVCGRRLLQGERPEIYLAGGARRTVCELCTVRANHQGWIRESAGLQLGSQGPRREDRRPVLQRLRGRRERQAPSGRGAQGGDGSGPGQDESHEPRREPRHVHAVPTSDELKASRALELFNASEHPRTVSGVARSLGPPTVSIRADQEHTSRVSITVAWELCWYRYEADLADEGLHGVRLAEQGYELSELDVQDHVANAAADDRGVLELAG